MTTARTTLTVFLLALAVAGPAAAQNGVVVDPDSPTGKEYAVPLDSARKQASKGSASPSSTSTRSTPLFGEGVGDDARATGARPRASRSAGQRETRSRGRRRARGGSPAVVAAAARPAAVRVPEADSGNSTLTIGAVALSVLLLGGVAGSIVRRRSS